MLREYVINTFFGAMIVLFFFIGPVFSNASLGLRMGLMGVGIHAIVLMLTALRDNARTRRIGARLAVLGASLTLGGFALHLFSN